MNISRSFGSMWHPLRWVLAAAALAIPAGVGGCGGSSSGLALGDCVTVRARFEDSTLDAAECTKRGEAFKQKMVVYRIVSVHEGTDASCPDTGYPQTVFSHEPDDKTYCLEVETGNRPWPRTE